MNDGKYVHTLVIGATFAGIAKAIAKGDAIIVDRMSGIGHEFVDTLNPCISAERPLETEAGKNFRNDLIQRNAYSPASSAVYPAAAAFVLSDMLKRAKIPFYPMTEILSVSEVDGLYTVRLFGPGGEESVSCREIFDTTSDHLSFPAYHDERPHMVYCVAVAETDILPDGFMKNPVSGLTACAIPLDGEQMSSNYREYVYNFFKDNRFTAFDIRLARIAPEIAHCFEGPIMREFMPHHIWMPSESCQSPIYAFDVGSR